MRTTPPDRIAAGWLALARARPPPSCRNHAWPSHGTLTPDDIADGYAELDADFEWALAVASFAEILKGSPFVEPERLDDIAAVVRAPEHASLGDRAEFVSLFERALPLVSARR